MILGGLGKTGDQSVSLGRLWGTFGEDFGRLLGDSGRLGEGFGETLGRLWEDFPTDRSTDRPTDRQTERPSDRPTVRRSIERDLRATVDGTVDNSLTDEQAKQMGSSPQGPKPLVLIAFGDFMTFFQWFL